MALEKDPTRQPSSDAWKRSRSERLNRNAWQPFDPTADKVELEIVERCFPRPNSGFWLIKINPLSLNSPFGIVLSGPFRTMEEAARALENELQLLP